MSELSSNSFGKITLFGSGETSASGRKTWEWLFRSRDKPHHLAILETPAGFQPNSYLVSYRVQEYLQTRLTNHPLKIEIVAARARESEFSPDHPALLRPICTANTIFMGAGSPTYAARQLEGSLAWDIVEARHFQGADVVFASAAILAASFYTLPVYEIYKVGEPLHWLTGLDFFSKFGLSAVFIPHWNNNDGGTELDTSRCFMGVARWKQLKALLPLGTPVVGIDEHTSLSLDPVTRTAQVFGKGCITIEMGEGDKSHSFPSGATLSFEELGTFYDKTSQKKLAHRPRREILALIADNQKPIDESGIPVQITQLMEKRTLARLQKDWTGADQIRIELLALGWTIQDTPNGPIANPIQSTHPG